MSVLVPLLEDALDSLRAGDANGAEGVLGQFAVPILGPDGRSAPILPRAVWVTHLMGRGQIAAAADELAAVIEHLKVGLVHRESGLTAWVGP